MKRDSLGLTAVFFCIATAAAPMTALLFNVPVIVSGAGWALPSAFIVALVMLLVFTVGYVEMTRRVTSAGGFYSFVSHGFGQTLGLGTASVITFHTRFSPRRSWASSPTWRRPRSAIGPARTFR